MKVTIIRDKGEREVVNREELIGVAGLIQKGWREKSVLHLRELYHLITVERQEDGRVKTNLKGGIQLERICFASEFDNYRGERRQLGYNGLVVIEKNGLETYEQAVEIRNKVSRMPQTVMAFLGASGKSVKIVVRGEMFRPPLTPPTQEGKKLPIGEEEIRQFHHNIYETARQAYQSQFGMEIEYLEPRLDRTVYMSADPEIYFNPEAMPFYGDAQPKESIERVKISDESDSLMPGRTLNRTYRLNWLFIVENVLGKALELPDADRQETLLMMVASACLAEGIPMARGIEMTLEHPVLNSDELLVRKTFSAVYAVSLQEDYFEKHKPKPLASVPKETIQAMQTEIFLNANFELRKNLMTGVAEYREKYAEDQTFKPLTEEVRNDMTLRAMELGLKSWDRDVNRFIDSTRIEQYDPVNTWLDKLPQWDGHDHIKDLAARVPTSQPHWEKYLRMWLVGMVAQWRESDKQLTGNALTPKDGSAVLDLVFPKGQLAVLESVYGDAAGVVGKVELHVLLAGRVDVVLPLGNSAAEPVILGSGGLGDKVLDGEGLHHVLALFALLADLERSLGHSDCEHHVLLLVKAGVGLDGNGNGLGLGRCLAVFGHHFNPVGFYYGPVTGGRELDGFGVAPLVKFQLGRGNLNGCGPEILRLFAGNHSHKDGSRSIHKCLEIHGINYCSNYSCINLQK